MSIVRNPDFASVEVLSSSVTSGNIAYNGVTGVNLTSLTLTPGTWLLRAEVTMRVPSVVSYIYFTHTSDTVGRVPESTQFFLTQENMSLSGIVTLNTSDTYFLQTRQNSGVSVANAYQESVSAGFSTPDNSIHMTAMRIST